MNEQERGQVCLPCCACEWVEMRIGIRPNLREGRRAGEWVEVDTECAWGYASARVDVCICVCWGGLNGGTRRPSPALAPCKGGNWAWAWSSGRARVFVRE